MGLFGWSYPAGCSGPPDEPDPPTNCDNCGVALPEENETGWCSSACEKVTQERWQHEAEGMYRGELEMTVMERMADLQGAWIGEWQPEPGQTEWIKNATNNDLEAWLSAHPIGKTS